MPIIEYRCADCGSKFEKLIRRTADSAELRCPACGQDSLKTELSTFAAHSRSSSGGPAPGMCPSGGVCPTPGACGLN